MKLTPGQSTILKRMLLSETAYLAAILMMSLTMIFDLSILTPGSMIFFGSLHYLAFLFFAFLVISGRSEHYKDPSMAFYQILVLMVTHIPIMYFTNHDIRGAALLCFVMPQMIAALKLNYRQSLHLAIYPILAYIAVCWFLARWRPAQFQRDVEISRTIVFATVSIWIAFFSGYVSRLRGELKAKRRELATTNATLLKTQSELVNAAHRAGMAEVAAEVLHNVGNSLNSMSVSAEVVRDTLRALKTSLIKRLAELLNQNQEDLPTFFKNDPRARRVPEAFSKFATALEKTHLNSLGEIDQLRASIEDLRHQLTEHQSYAVGARYRQGVIVNGLIEEVLSVLDIELEAEGVTIQLTLRPVPETLLEKAKFSQVVMHVVQNAREAMATLPAGMERMLTIENRIENDTLYLDIKDTGGGIPEENLARLFASGFSTKDGSGQGLHYSANAMNEMGGGITATNRADRLGAVFTLHLPLDHTPPETAVDTSPPTPQT